MKILVTGANGFVGHKIMELCGNTVPSPSLRNATRDDIYRVIWEADPDVVIHTAAISDIGACQADPDASYLANVKIPIWLAEACTDRKLICFSSDQVYSACDEDGPYTEDSVKPGNLYAAHKLEMEQRVLDIHPSSVMLRAEWMYDYYTARSNYFMTVLNAEDSVSFSSRQYRGVTYLKEVALNMEKVMELPGGAYNFGSETDDPIYEITEKFLSVIGKKLEIRDSSDKHNLWMDCSKARKYGVVFSNVLDGLVSCARDYGVIV